MSATLSGASPSGALASAGSANGVAKDIKNNSVRNTGMLRMALPSRLVIKRLTLSQFLVRRTLKIRPSM